LRLKYNFNLLASGSAVTVTISGAMGDSHCGSREKKSRATLESAENAGQ